MAIVIVQAVVAIPTSQVSDVLPRDYPEVIPGPGLPSLASLNLTSAELYEMTPASTHHLFPHLIAYRARSPADQSNRHS